jgi:cell wall-associated NlpC family hydrolase
MRVYEQFGIYLPHSSSAQAGYGTKISASEAKPGDLFFYGRSGVSGIGHVAIYIGNGQIVHASNARDGIKISNAYYRTPIKVVRLLSD